jgi:hypothetical protein
MKDLDLDGAVKYRQALNRSHCAGAVWHTVVDLKHAASRARLFNRINNFGTACMGRRTLQDIVCACGTSVDALQMWLQFRPPQLFELMYMAVAAMQARALATRDPVGDLLVAHLNQALAAPGRGAKQAAAAFAVWQRDLPKQCVPIEAGRDAECVVCMKADRPRWIQLPCKHQFCRLCVQTWLATTEAAGLTTGCPLCRTPI